MDGIIIADKEQGKYYYSVFKYKTKDDQTFEFNYTIALSLIAAAIFGGEKLFKLYKKIMRIEFYRTLIKETWQDIKKDKKPTSKTHDKKRRILEKIEIFKKA